MGEDVHMERGTTSDEPDPDDQAGWLSIGEFARVAQMRPTTVRAWEARYGFPVPMRLPSGHRRYAEDDARRVREITQLKDAGVRLETAIARVTSARDSRERGTSRSIYADVRRRHPGLAVHRLQKSTLRGLSWAIEDEVRATVSSAYLFAAFQEQRFYEPARPRWLDLSAFSRAAFVYADFEAPTQEANLVSVPLAGDAPLRNEWSVVCDGPDFAAALSAWELPRQEVRADRERLFEAVWTIDPVVVRDAARVAAHVADLAGAPRAADAVAYLAAPAPVTVVDTAAMALYNRVLAYVDREHS